MFRLHNDTGHYWVTNFQGFTRNRSDQIENNTQTFIWSDWGRIRKASNRIPGSLNRYFNSGYIGFERVLYIEFDNLITLVSSRIHPFVIRLKSTDVSEENIHLQGRRWRRHIPPKHPLIFRGTPLYPKSWKSSVLHTLNFRISCEALHLLALPRTCFSKH
jgi:hypothetical protein